MRSNLVEYVLTHVDQTKYYKSRFPEYDGLKGSNIPCPKAEERHEKSTDSKPSFSVNIGESGGCYCHACELRVGSLLHMEKILTGETSDEKIAEGLYREFCISPVDAKILEAYKGRLRKSKSFAGQVCVDLGLEPSDLEKFELGLDPRSKRLTIPIFDAWGNLLNIRYYRLPSQRTASDNCKIYSEEGFGTPRFFPQQLLSSFDSNTIYWMKAERDTMLAWSKGIPAFCYVAGENNKSYEKQVEFFKSLNCKIIICGDNDSVGERSVQEKITFLKLHRIPCGYIRVPKHKDFSDWIIREDKKKEDFLALPISEHLESFQSLEPHIVAEVFPGMEDNSEFELEGSFEVVDISCKNELLNRVISVKGIISGKTERSYSIPSLVDVRGKFYRIPIGREMVHMVKTSDGDISSFLSKFFPNRKKVDMQIIDYATITEVEITPVLVPGKDSVYINQRCFFIGEKIETNMPHELKIMPVSLIKSQETVGIILDSSPLIDVLENAGKMTEEDIDALAAKFSIRGKITGEQIYKSLLELVKEISQRHTYISCREDLHLSQLLTWCSPLQFNFFREGVQRGWLNTLNLGDTQTGKSEIAKKLRELFHCGAFISAENCTFVGLIGGAVKAASGNFMLRWGKIPLYNKQLVVLEEMSGLSTDNISKMSDVRSAGIARLDKGGLSGETSAKTRLLCIANVRRSGANISDYSSGVKAVQELIGQNEDISRFDIILTVTDRDVSDEVINQNQLNTKFNPYTEPEKEVFKKLVAFIWALQIDNISITDEAYDRILKVTTEFGKVYHNYIPIFKTGSGRQKIARIACAIACLTFSYDRVKAQIIVNEHHVDAAAILLRHFYGKESLGYEKFSRHMFYLENLVDEEGLDALVIDKCLKNGDSKEIFFRNLLIRNTIDRDELSQILGISLPIIDRIIAKMVNSNCIRRVPNTPKIIWELTYPGRKWASKHHSI